MPQAAVDAGHFASATTLSLNACPLVTYLPDLSGMRSLRTLTLINASALERLPDLSSLPELRVVKLENCSNLAALPSLPPGIEWDDNHLPEHLRSQPEN